ncbi:hypothetical protein EJ05DRAFT_171808 [Pseudovirgaria hyperparasitica]|uniref:Uncharacterized protein n=1 Tax=Pseudovirgaria hyperparasitica TaxID=470096 RepID=A0A6A6VX19_9PEZI|nr:uncharacterized protein EJ05DRAFT_171808 [Pseudovirgaria hyperparasitica]KAF2753791.1 hypothetical protein EJ05DRAFT_171808 [Pseudovirgaria hyperparasitica]
MHLCMQEPIPRIPRKPFSPSRLHTHILSPYYISTSQLFSFFPLQAGGFTTRFLALYLSYFSPEFFFHFSHFSKSCFFISYFPLIFLFISLLLYFPFSFFFFFFGFVFCFSFSFFLQSTWMHAEHTYIHVCMTCIYPYYIPHICSTSTCMHAYDILESCFC